jgi:hypothetical protein
MEPDLKTKLMKHKMKMTSRFIWPNICSGLTYTPRLTTYWELEVQLHEITSEIDGE